MTTANTNVQYNIKPETLFQPSEFDKIASSTLIHKPPPRPGIPEWNIRTDSDMHIETLGIKLIDWT